ncbi:MAG: hypothetical protein IPO35_19385 [Uliginosibacterium sp.]|nr:hypothetical protein [Uliginosibacterium sp.]
MARRPFLTLALKQACSSARLPRRIGKPDAINKMRGLAEATQADFRPGAPA